MTEERRKLAAIMFTDLVGYSALSEKNEALALELLEVKRKTIEAHLRQHAGRIIKSTGDGFLLEFGSAIEAVRYASVVQSALKDRNQTVDEEHAFQIRIGIHLGDIVYKDDDVFGDGVNIAARIEPLAEPGGIAISDGVYDLVHNKIPLGFLSVGKPELKNIETPIEVFHVVEPGVRGLSSSPRKQRTPDSERGEAQRKLSPVLMAASALVVLVAAWVLVSTLLLGDRVYDGPVEIEAIAVLPLENIGGSEDDEFFSDGMTEEILNNLAQLEGIRVISRTSVFNLKGTDLNLSEIGIRLAVDHVLEGSVRRSGDQIRIIVRMVRVEDGTTIWSQQYNRTMNDAFQIQDEIARSISTRIEVELAGDQALADVVNAESIDPEAYEAYLKGRFYWNKRNFQGFQQARNKFLEAIELDPNFAEAHAGLADTYSLMASYGYMEADDAYERAKEAAERALEINDQLAEAITSLAFVYHHDEDIKDLDRAEQLYQQAIEANPNYASAHHWYSNLLIETGRDEESLEEIERALQLDPLSPIINVAVGNHYTRSEDYETARAYYEQALEIDPLFVAARLGLANLNALQQDFSAAEAHVESLAEESPTDVRAIVNLATVKMFVWKWDEAEQAYRRAINLEEGSANEATARLQYAIFLGLTGRSEDAVQQIDRGIELNSDLQNAGTIRTLYLGQDLFRKSDGNYETLISKMREIKAQEDVADLELAAALLFEAYGVALQNEYDEALRLIDEAESLIGPSAQSEDPVAVALTRSVLGQRGLVFAMQGDRESAENVIEELIEIKDITGIPYNISLIYLHLEEIDEAFQWLEVGVTQHDFVTATMAFDSFWEPLRSDPRFEQLLREMNMWDRYQEYVNSEEMR